METDERKCNAGNQALVLSAGFSLLSSASRIQIVFHLPTGLLFSALLDAIYFFTYFSVHSYFLTYSIAFIIWLCNTVI